MCPPSFWIVPEKACRQLMPVEPFRQSYNWRHRITNQADFKQSAAVLPVAHLMVSKEQALENKRKVVLGLGNLLQKDEGFGVRVVQALEAEMGRELRRDQVELVDGGKLGQDLLPLVEECSHLLVLDAVDSQARPGTLVELSKEQIPRFAGIQLSPRQVTFQEVLALADLRGSLPEQVYLIGIQPCDLGSGQELSQEVEQKLPRAVLRAVEVLRGWGIVNF